MNLAFTNGTDRQQGLVRAAVALATYDFDRLDMSVTVSFVDESVLDLNPNDGQYVFATTTYSTSITDNCGRAGTAEIKVMDTLDDPDRTGPFSGEQFFMETIIHELGHCVQAKLSAGQVGQVCVALGCPVEDWDNPDKPWTQQGKEAWAESFKDVYLPRNYRRYDDRTIYRLTDDDHSFGLFLSVIDDVCPCVGGVESS